MGECQSVVQVSASKDMVAILSSLRSLFNCSLVFWSSIIGILGLLATVVSGQANPSSPPGANPGATSVHQRFEYKYSFKPPYLAQRDGTVPFWEYGGSKYKFITIIDSNPF